MEILSGFHVKPSTVLELGGTKNDFISVPMSNSLLLFSVLPHFPASPSLLCPGDHLYIVSATCVRAVPNVDAHHTRAHKY